MAIKNRQTLKSYFVKNAIPTEGNFADLIDTQLNQADDGLFKVADEPLSVVAAPGAQRRVLRLYSDYPAANPDWLVCLKPAQSPADAASARDGLGISDGAGNTRLFLSPNGQLGVGTNTPLDKLHLSGGDLRIEGGTSRKLKIISDRRGSGIQLHARGEGDDAGAPFIDFTKGDVGGSAFGVRLVSPNNASLKIEASEGAAALTVAGTSTADRVVIRGANWDSPLDVSVPKGKPGWNRFVVTATDNWGTADNKYVTIGAGGASGIMLHNPHVCWQGGGHSRASIRYGRVGGQHGNLFWDVGARANGSFSFRTEQGDGAGDQVNIAKSGELTAKVGLRVDGNRSDHIDKDGALYRCAGEVYLTVDNNLYFRDTDGSSRIHFNTNNGRILAKEVSTTDVVTQGLTIEGAGHDTPLHVTLPGTTDGWGRFCVTETNNWGNSGGKYATIGAGDSSGIMFRNPYVVWDGTAKRASIRYGRVGSTPGKTFWDVGVREDASFSFISASDGAAGETVKIKKSGELVATHGLQFEGGRSSHIDVDGALYRCAGEVFLTVDNNLYFRDTDGSSRIHFNTNDGRIRAKEVKATDVVTQGLTVEGADHDVPLHVSVPKGENNWDRFVVTTTDYWSSTTPYVTIGAGGAAGIMFYNPHVVWQGGTQKRASIRYGRTKGRPGKTYWDVGVREDASFSFEAMQDGAAGEALKIEKNGKVIARASLRVQGNIDVTGRISSPLSKFFQIDHPNRPDHCLVHACIEGPESAVFYRGEARLVGGRCEVKLPAYFEALVRSEHRTVLLTPLFEADEPISNLAASPVVDGRFRVRAIDSANLQQRFYWEVKATRGDVDSLEVEVPKAKA